MQQENQKLQKDYVEAFERNLLPKVQAKAVDKEGRLHFIEEKSEKEDDDIWHRTNTIENAVDQQNFTK